MNAGDRIRHPTATEWGIGQILNIEGSKADVFFVEAGTKTISLRHVSLTILDPPPRHRLLDQLDPTPVGGPAYRSVRQSIKDFLGRYPGGFHGDRYLREERDYKVEAHKLAKTILGRAELEQLLANGAFAARVPERVAGS